MSLKSHRGQWVNSLVPDKCGSNSIIVISKHVLQLEFMSKFCKIALKWKPLNTFDDKSTLVPSDNKLLPEPKLTQIYVAI